MPRQRPTALLLDFDGVVRRYDPATAGDGRGGEVVPEVLDLVREVRAAGHPVALTPNSGEGLAEHLAQLGLTEEFDSVVTSAGPGVYKPSREFFAAVCLAVATPPERCLFVDDQYRNVQGARAAGLSAYRWNGPQDVPYLRAALGLAPGR
ncbi:MAG TPA: HAD-IA family hydrolase [Micromonosporaceae bacterium]